jgi:hypothetical protein
MKYPEIGRFRRVDIREEIVARVDELPAELQERVLRFVTSLSATAPKGESGAALRRFSGVLDPKSAQEMVEAIEEQISPWPANTVACVAGFGRSGGLFRRTTFGSRRQRFVTT